jgi:uncharacterized membrane protein
VKHHLGSQERDRGAVLPIVALSLVVLMTMTAFSVDLGRQILRRRQAQTVADVVALDLARQLGGRTTSAIQSDPNWDQARINSANRNDFPPSGVTAVLGRWNEDGSTFTPTSGSEVPTAVQVSAQDDVDFYFARVIGFANGHVSRNGTASFAGTTTITTDHDGGDSDTVPDGGGGDDDSDGGHTLSGAHAWGQIGSVFAGFQYYNEPGMTAQYNLAAELRAKVMNSELYTQLGMTAGGSVLAPPVGLNLTAISYKGLANGSFLLGDLATAAGFGSVNDLLKANLRAKSLITAEVAALTAGGTVADLNAASILGTFANQVSNTLLVSVGDFLTVDQGSGSSAANYSLNALQFLSNAAEMMNGKNFFSTTVAVSNIPGVTSLPVKVAIIESPQQWDNVAGSGPCNVSLLNAGCGPRTAQVRISTSIPVTLDLTSALGVPLIQSTTIPIIIEAASAQSYFSSINCADPTSNDTTDFRVVSNGVAMHIGTVSDAVLQANAAMTVQAQALLHGSVTLGLASLNLDSLTNVKVDKTFKNGAILTGDIESNANVLGADETHRFTGSDPSNITPPSWRYAGGVGSTNVSNTVFSSLGITNAALNSAMTSALQSSLANLDTYFVDPMLSSLGVSIAGADGAVTKVACSVRLVN